MTAIRWLGVVPWLVLIGYWAVSSVGVKRGVRDGGVWRREIGFRLLVIALVLLAVHVAVLRHALARMSEPNGAWLSGLIGGVLCCLGAGFAIWARAVLGTNWGAPLSRKEHPALVTNGPYGSVRHPIYSGFILAMLGSAIGESLIWVVPLVVLGGYFVYMARREEKLMTELFPDAYPAYVERTKMLLPFIL